MRVLVTGGCGFIGHHVVEHLYRNTNWDIIIVDKLSYASNGYERLRDIFDERDIHGFDTKRIQLHAYDLVNEFPEGLKKEFGNIDYVIHMAAETHVDNSIKDPKLFITNNILSTYTILEFCRHHKPLKKLIHFSTDEVYGPALDGKLFEEHERHNPTNPYSASKSAAEQICTSYKNTFKVPLIVVNVMNAFGERQHIEKFIPLCIKNIMNDVPINIHTYPDGKTPGSRFYIHCRNIASGVLHLIDKGEIGEYYNIGGTEIDNLEVVNLISKFLNKAVEINLVPEDENRPGHDLRYGLNDNKIKDSGWVCPLSFEESLENMVNWTILNKKWLT
tara:strand:- start:1827 stop:2822 length:996 start_codon:yes stop_codon:yes gene_type:complete